MYSALHKTVLDLVIKIQYTVSGADRTPITVYTYAPNSCSVQPDEVSGMSVCPTSCATVHTVEKQKGIQKIGTLSPNKRSMCVRASLEHGSGLNCSGLIFGLQSLFGLHSYLVRAWIIHCSGVVVVRASITIRASIIVRACLIHCSGFRVVFR